MKKLLLLSILFLLFTGYVNAQTKPLVKNDTTHNNLALKPKVPDQINIDTTKIDSSKRTKTEKFVKVDSAAIKLAAKQKAAQHGKIDSADLKLTSCFFEKDANAMVLYDKGEMVFTGANNFMERHRKIKIFNDNGRSEANIRIEYSNKFGAEHILAVEAESINFNNGKIEYTKLDQSLVYNVRTDKNKDAVVFSIPNVKAGSVIEYGYIWTRDPSRNFPDWDFQSSLPTLLSQVNIFINPILSFTALYKNYQPFIKDTISIGGLGHIWALANVPSSKKEPYMRSSVDGLQSISFILSAVKINGKTENVLESWAKLGKQLANSKDFIKPYDQSLNNEAELVSKARALSTDDQKIAFLFNQVKDLMKWNADENWFSKEGIRSAWKKKTGNWSEINMVLCHLLNQSGVKAYPLLVSTRDNGKIYPDFINIFQINKVVTYVPVDSTKYYVLDAIEKTNIYNEIPFNLLNSYGLSLNKEKDKYELVLMKKEKPVKQAVFINAEIKPDGIMTGIAQINSFSYNKSESLKLFKDLGEKKYMEFLSDNDNNLKISTLKFENAEIDSLPLTQNIDFKLDLPGTDEKYIYFNPNLFTGLHSNPFISEIRFTDIDFGCRYIYSINARYKMPAGYKIEALPKSMTLLLFDKSISFKRIVVEQEGYIIINYVIDYKKSIYQRADYPDIYAYFKKMHETLNEQIVLKKS